MKIDTICGLPGFGSPGRDGVAGSAGNNIFINNSSEELHKVISLNDLVLYENGDVHIVDYYDKFSGYTTKLIDKNIIKTPFSKDGSTVYTTYDVKLGTNIKTTQQLNNLDNKINLIFKETDSSIVKINDDIDLCFNKNDEVLKYYSVNTSHNIAIDNLYVDDNTNIITTTNCNNMELLLKSFETIVNENDNAVTMINYKCHDDDFLLLGIDKNNKTRILRDFNYNGDIVEFPSDEIMYYRLFYKMRKGHDEALFRIFTNDSVKPDVTPGDEPTIDSNFNIVNVETYNSYTNIYNGDKNIIFTQIDSSNDIENTEYDAKITFSDDIVTCNISNKKLFFDYSGNALYFNNLNGIGNGNHIVKITVNCITYNLSIENKSLSNIIDTKTTASISEYSDGYLSLTDEKYGVPVNSFMEAYKISIKNKNNNNIKFDINVSFSNEISSDVSIYYKIFGVNEIDSISSKSIISDLGNVKIINNEFNKATFSDIEYLNEENCILVLYYEFNDPFMTFITSDVVVKCDNDELATMSKKTYVIPWEISSMNHIISDDGIDTRIHNTVSVPIGDNIFPRDLTSIKISPAINLYDGNHVDSKFNYKRIDNLSNAIYPSTFYLMLGYNMPRNNNVVEFIVKASRLEDEITYVGSQYQYSQIENKYPIWMPVDANINLINDDCSIYDNYKHYTYLNTFPTTSKSEFDPTSPNGLIVKRFPVANKEQTIISNIFDFLSFAKWTLPITTYDGSTMTYNTNVFDFADMNTCRTNNDRNSTLYSLYWQMTPRFVKKTAADIYLDGAVNLLKMPKIANANTGNCFILNEIANNFIKNNTFTINPSLSLNDLLYTEINKDVFNKNNKNPKIK